MARLHEIADSDDELPDLSKILVSVDKSQHGVRRNNQPSSEKPPGATKTQVILLSPGKDSTDRSLRISSIQGNVEASLRNRQARKQKPLRLAHVNSLLLPTVNGPSKSPGKRAIAIKQSENEGLLREIPGRAAAQRVDSAHLVADLRDTLDSTEDDTSSDNLSDFIVNDSASETEMEPSRSVKTYRKGSPKKLQRKIENNRGSNDDDIIRQPESLHVTTDLIFPDKKHIPAQNTESYPAMLKTRASPNDEFNVDSFSNLRLWVAPDNYI